VHIELTDHLRCPREHAEAFLVLLPDQMDQRRVIAGHLGCPMCGWSTAWTNGVPDFGGTWRGNGAPPFDAAGAQAMLGADGPGGWVALAGNAGALAEPLAMLLPGVSFVAINPPDDVTPSVTTSVILSDAWPLKTHSMRGVILGGDAVQWREAGMATTLPGLRTIGCGEAPSGVQILGNADGVWVATHR
jgi:hypothetical protein